MSASGATEPEASATSNVVVGLMSGTSLDGISAAVARFTEHDDAESGSRITADLLGFVVRPYSERQRERLAAAMTGATPAEYARLGFDLGGWLADAAVAVMAEAGITSHSLRAVASHGQTIWHEPGQATWQLGEAAVIAERLGVDVVSNFRVADVAAGGQGAPLVPMADALLFSSPGHWRALQNIGGIGNVTVVPPAGRLAGVRAFDTGPGVAVLDGVVRLLVPTLPYDEDGRLAAEGAAIDHVVDALLEEPYFAASPPKSTGRELFNAAFVRDFVVRCRAAKESARDEDIIATAVSLTARSVADAYRRFLPEPLEEVLVSGGGARHPGLVAELTRRLAPLVVRRFDDIYVDGEAKEALAFALLGHLHLTGRPGNVPTATGARGPRILGTLTPGRPAERGSMFCPPTAATIRRSA
ncbi:MAG: anhydro-N-acetylmuramic acid kinase [Gemmatimonadaceae bacterium]